MSFDLSRMSFDPLKDYLGVVMQQGRVQMDADWNDFFKQFQRRIQTGSLDTFFDNVVPRVTPDGFLISPSGSDFTIGPGRIYVDGILAENHHELPMVWNRALEEMTGSGSVAYDDQPYYPEPDATPSGDYLVYLDVWRRDITYLQDPELVEKAVGVESTGRMQTIWQVKVLDGMEGVTPATPEEDIPDWLETIHPSSARLTTSTGDLPGEENPCLLPPEAGYKGLENQLYRVEVHRGGDFGQATFKWSRDNATVASRVTAIPQLNQLIVESVGRDDVLRFNDGDWVEVTDDYRLFHGLPGEMRRIQLGDGVDDATRTINLEQNLTAGLFPVNAQGETDASRNTIVRRWDQAAIVREEDSSPYYDLNDPLNSGDISIPDTGTRVFLEHGILVEFTLASTGESFSGEFKTGDYWLVAARTVDASIELLNEAPPLGIHHHYTKLAIVTDGVPNDCRTLWPPIFEGQGCDCTICVTPESHNSGAGTIQQAIDAVVANGGGTVCLGAGQYTISNTLNVHNAASVKIRGQGWTTILFSREPNIVIDVLSSSDVRLENFTLIAAAQEGASSPVIDVRNVLGFTTEHCNIFNFAAGNTTSAGMRLSGFAFMTEIKDCLLFAERGFIGPSTQESYLATLNFSIDNCAMFATQRGISLEGLSFHGFRTNISNNLIIGAEQAGMVFNGAQLINSDFDIRDNSISLCVNGIRTGITNTRITGNDLWGQLADEEAGDAISIEAGLDPEKLDNLQIIANRARNFSGHGIVIREDVGKAMVKQNQMSDLTGASFFIESGSVEYLSLENNQFSRISGRVPGFPGEMVGAFLQGVRRADISNNILDGIVQDDATAVVRAGIALLACDELRINGNRIFSVGPANYAGLGIGLMANIILSHLDINNNSINRADGDENLNVAAWIPLFARGGLGRLGNDTGENFSRAPLKDGVSTFAGSVFVVSGKSFLLVNSRQLKVLSVRSRESGSVSIQQNRFIGENTNQIMVQVETTQSCQFMSNECIGSVEAAAANISLLATVEADHINASNNRLVGIGDSDVMRLNSNKFVVVGNMSTGNIRIGAGGVLPAPWDALNIII